MTLRAARRAARRAYHRAAHLDTFAAEPTHEPEQCEVDADVSGYRLDAVLAAAAPILRRHAVQEHARRYGRRTVQFTAAERAALRFALSVVIVEQEGAVLDRAGRLRVQALRRALGKIDALTG